MSALRKAVGRLLLGEEGASLAEYAVALFLIAAVTVAVISLLGNSISTFLKNAAGSI